LPDYAQIGLRGVVDRKPQVKNFARKRRQRLFSIDLTFFRGYLAAIVRRVKDLICRFEFQAQLLFGKRGDNHIRKRRRVTIAAKKA
jgi:hypothetical protein